METLRVAFVLIACTISSAVNAQWSAEAQLAGSNFLGASLNLNYSLSISANGDHKLTPTIGLGLSSNEWMPTSRMIIHAGLNYSYKRYGIGVEASQFGPLFPKDGVAYDNELIVFPNINYLIVDRDMWYLKASLGAYFAFSELDGIDDKPTPTLSFEGDVIAGAGLSVGIKLFK